MTSTPTHGPAALFHQVRGSLAAGIGKLLRVEISPDLVGFLLLSSTTFAIDLAILTTLRAAGVPLWLCLGAAYGTALTLNYLLNRTLNFDRSDRPVGGEVLWYCAVVAVNYTAIVVGISLALTSAGVHYQVARIVAACVEVVYMYLALRFVVFRRR